MTTVVTRLFENESAATPVIAALVKEGFPQEAIDVIGSGGEDVEATLARMAAARVPRPAASAYVSHLKDQRVLLVVRAPFVPFGASRRAIELADSQPSIDAGVANENYHISERPAPGLFTSTLSDHPRFLSGDYGPGRSRLLMSNAFGIPLLSGKNRRGRSAIKGGALMLPFWKPRSRQRRTSVLKGGGRITRGLGLPVISRRG